MVEDLLTEVAKYLMPGGRVDIKEALKRGGCHGIKVVRVVTSKEDLTGLVILHTKTQIRQIQ